MITVGVPTYNGAPRLNELLCSLALRTQPGDWRVVVVDDGSPRGAEVARIVEVWRNRLPIDFVRHDVNRGISAGWNTAARLHAAEHVVLINDDVILPSGGWLEALLFPLKADAERARREGNQTRVGSVGCNWHAFLDEDVDGLLAGIGSDQKVVPRNPRGADGVAHRAPERRAMEENPPGRVMCPTGQLFAFRRADFDAVGGFDEAYKSFFEESAFGTRCAERGQISVVLNYPQCWHRWSATFGSSPELDAGTRMDRSRHRYREVFQVPDDVPWCHEFDYTNPKLMGAIPPVEVEYLKKGGGAGRVTL